MTHLPADLPVNLLIGGDDVPTPQSFDVTDPATEEVLVRVADADAGHAEAALDAATSAWPQWRAVSPRERGELLRAVFETVTARSEEIAALITAECGKPLAESRTEVAYGADFLRWYAEQAVRFAGGVRTAPAGGARQLVQRRPVGPVLLITPWNFPLAMGTRKIAAALAAGCPVIVKPAQLTPLTTLLLGRIVEDEARRRKLPSGLVQVITTTDAGSITGPLMADMRLRKVSFTGSTAVGRSLLRSAAQNVLRTSMELGGNAPFLVFADADLDAAIDGLLAAKMRNAGQTCVAANRIYVHDSIIDDFTDRLTAAFRTLPVGPGTRDGVKVGPLIRASAVADMAELVAQATADGARVTVGGTAPGGRGYFYPPTVVARVNADSGLLRHEIFGPVAPVTPFSDANEAIRLANDTDAGLVAYAYTRELDLAMRLTDELEAGMIGINRGMVSDASAPFGGMKTSGLGREGGELGIEEYLEPVYVSL